MGDRYAAILRGNRLEWTGTAPTNSEGGEAAVVTVILRETATGQGEAMAAALEQLAQEDPPTGLGDPAQWERSIRQDRRLPGRDDAC